MKRDDIIKLMQQACDPDKKPAWHNEFWTITQEELERFAHFVLRTERQACAELVQVPVAWMDREGDLYKMPEIEGWAPPHTLLYTHPPQRKPPTDQQKLDLVTNWFAEDWAIKKALSLLRDYDIGGKE